MLDSWVCIHFYTNIFKCNFQIFHFEMDDLFCNDSVRLNLFNSNIWLVQRYFCVLRSVCVIIVKGWMYSSSQLIGLYPAFTTPFCSQWTLATALCLCHLIAPSLLVPGSVLNSLCHPFLVSPAKAKERNQLFPHWFMWSASSCFISLMQLWCQPHSFDCNQETTQGQGCSSLLKDDCAHFWTTVVFFSVWVSKMTLHVLTVISFFYSFSGEFLSRTQQIANKCTVEP